MDLQDFSTLFDNRKHLLFNSGKENPESTRKALHLRRLVAIFFLTGADYN
jgi:hypothetical protein